METSSVSSNQPGGSSQMGLDTKTRSTIYEVYKAFITENNMPEIIHILLQEEVDVHYAVVSDCTAILKVDLTLADVLFFFPEQTMKLLTKTLADVCQVVYKSHPLNAHMVLKQHLHARIKNLPMCSELCRERIPKSKDIGKFLAIDGTVIRTGAVKLLEYEQELMCSKCKNVFSVKADISQYYKLPTPGRCPLKRNCNSTKYVMVSHSDTQTGSKKCKDFQEIRIQEQLRRLAMGTIPRTITVILEDDLVDVCKAGDDVVVYGTVMCRWQQLYNGKPCDIELVIKANYVEVRNEQQLGASVKEEMQNDFECFWAAHVDNPMLGRNFILASLCPQIYGLYVVKLAVALVLAGGVPRTDESGSRVRGDAHLLLVGDPGTGKSQFLKYASKITPRSVLTTGIGSTTAGLTVTAVRDGSQWALEAGALVLADGGICCIDEFASIKEHDRSAIHEAMEQQTVSVAKAGLVCKLNTRTSVLAATNPKLGKYDITSSMNVNIAMASPLLSRFDIVLILLDGKSEKWDSVVADYVFTEKEAAIKKEQKLWTMEQMQAYFCLIRQLNPVLSPSANTILSEYYRSHRRSDNRDAARTTIRLLESLIRLAEAHAKLMYKETVEVVDAIAAITVMESSMQGSSLLTTGSVLHSCFPSDPAEEYKKHARLVLKRLGLDEILAVEMNNIAKRSNSLPLPGQSQRSTSQSIPRSTSYIQDRLFSTQRNIRSPMIESQSSNVANETISDAFDVGQDSQARTNKSFRTSTQNSSQDIFNVTSSTEHGFSRMSRIDTTSLDSFQRKSAMGNKTPNFPPKKSFFSLDPSNVEGMCEDFDFDKENSTEDSFSKIFGMKRDPICDAIINATQVQQDSKASSAFSKTNSKNLFHIDDTNFFSDF